MYMQVGRIIFVRSKQILSKCALKIVSKTYIPKNNLNYRYLKNYR